MTKRFRFWMSGCVAVISLALGGPGDAWADDGDAKPGVWQTSRFDMTQTLQRLRACAPQHGLSVLACWAPRQAAAIDPSLDSRASAASSAAQSILVFATREGGTPVLMDSEHARPDLPLSLHLRLRSDGLVEVLLPTQSYGDEMPDEVARELTGLPDLVAHALA